MFLIRCIGCGEIYSKEEVVYTCRRCGDLLNIEYDYPAIKRELRLDELSERPLGVWKYRKLLPITNPHLAVSLMEGGTRLHRCEGLATKLGVRELYVKNEGDNPTGSFKDRGMTVGVTKALELRARTVICASTGNTSASLSAYAAKAGLRCIVFIPSGKIAYGKLAQAMVYGAEVIQILGNFDHALKLARELCDRNKEIYLLNSINPYRVEGQKTLAYELCEQLNFKVPDKVIVPVGNAANISAIWKGFLEFRKLGFTDSLPEMVGIQAEGASPIVRAFKEGRDTIEPVKTPETVATAIRIGHPVSWKKALQAIRDSGGTAEAVTDEEILEAQKLLARREGLFVEPASASSIAGLRRLLGEGRIAKDDLVVCVATGHGLKDADIVIKTCEKPAEIEASMESVKRALGVQS
ncbi:MAG: threonine synthase [Candidatus Bathyarchaeia archaeon]